MNVLLRVAGYDKQTECLSVEHKLPAYAIAEARDLAHIADDDDGFGAYPLAPAAAITLGLKIDYPLNVNLYDWFVEPA